MPHAVSAPSPGLQALILCGPGSSFSTFNSNPDENPKALLPIANRPMVWYPLDFCYRTGVTNITLVCPPSAEKAITAALNTNPSLTGLPLPRPDVLAPKDLDHTTGTATILRLPQVKAVIQTDFMVLPCDLICELEGEKLIQAWMVKAASMKQILGLETAEESLKEHSGALGVWYNTKTTPIIKGQETDFIATTPLQASSDLPSKDNVLTHLSNLVYTVPTDSLKDTMEMCEAFKVRHGLVQAHPRVRMLTTHRDAHLYILPKWILDFVDANDRLESISEDLIGFWAKAGWQPGLADKLRMRQSCEEKSTISKPEPSSDDVTSQLIASRNITPLDRSTLQKSFSFLTLEDVAKQRPTAVDSPAFEVPSVLAYVHPPKDTEKLIRRVDTASLLLVVSLQLAKLPSAEEGGSDLSRFAHARKISYPEGVKSRTTITKQDCLLAENVTVEEKTSIKECVIGANCQIREGAKLSQCLLMEGVTVGKGCKLTKCILGKRSVIGDGSVLTDCEVQEHLLVEPRTEDKDSKLMSSEGLEATEAEVEELLQEQADAQGDQEIAVED